MQVGNVQSNIYTASMLQARSGSGRVSVPVKPTLSLYARYKHVQGIPAHDPQGAVPLSKVRTLNHVIDRLVQMRKNSAGEAASRGAEDVPPEEQLQGMSDEALDAMIQQMTEKLQTAIKHQGPGQGQLSQGMTAGMGLQGGALFSLTA